MILLIENKLYICFLFTDGKTYYISNILRIDWMQGFNFCKFTNMTMVTLETLAEMSNFQTLMSKATFKSGETQIHLGASCNDPATKKNWFWFKPGTAVAYTLPWDTKFPKTTDTTANCMTITIGGRLLNNVPCYGLNALFACQKMA